MHPLPEIIKAVREIVDKPNARCVILSSDGAFESSLVGTRDGYLNLALALLQLVAAGDSQSTESTEIDRLNDEHAYWSDNLKKTFNQLPGSHAYIVGSYLFDDHPFQSRVPLEPRFQHPTGGVRFLATPQVADPARN